MQVSEDELIVRSLAADADAFGILVDRYKQAIYYHCFAMVHDEATAEDIAQDSFIAAYYKLSSFDRSRKFSTWLFRIATNNALNHLKRDKKTTEMSEELIGSIASTLASPAVEAENSELHSAVAKLQPKYRAVISLYYWQGMDYAEIAAVLGVPQGSVKGWMNRAKLALRKELV